MRSPLIMITEPILILLMLLKAHICKDGRFVNIMALYRHPYHASHHLTERKLITFGTQRPRKKRKTNKKLLLKRLTFKGAHCK